MRIYPACSGEVNPQHCKGLGQLKNRFRNKMAFTRLLHNTIIAFFFCLLWGFLWGCAVPHGGNGRTSHLLNQAIDQLADDLDRRINLAGKVIQISENNFWQRGTRLNLPFSAVLSDALAAAVSERGATITVQEVGRKPLRLLGTYGTEGSQLVINIQIRRMGETASKDMAVARTGLSETGLDRSWFKPEFDRVARTLIRLLEENYLGLDYHIQLEISPLQPGFPGQPPLLIGKEFGRFLETAVAGSALVGTSSPGQKSTACRLHGTYTRAGTKMTFHVRISDSDGRRLSSAVFDVWLADIPTNLLKPVSEKAFVGKGTAVISHQCRLNEKPCPPKSVLINRALRTVKLLAMRDLGERAGINMNSLSMVVSGQLKADKVVTKSHGTLRNLQYLEPVINGDQVSIELIAEVD